jgi:ATP-dependent Clp protease ATP-binding subunit ClpX
MEGVELEFGEDALRALAEKALKKGTGARALRSLLERMMLEVMYEVPGSKDISTVTVTRQAVEDGVSPLIRRKAGQKAA